jgi:hypothetical protein
MPAVRHLALRWLLDEPEDSPEVRSALAAAMAADPIFTTLVAQHRDGYWVKPGPGYSPKYTGTIWCLSFLDQAGADPADERIRNGCSYVLRHTQAGCGGFGYDGSNGGVVHCLNGNLLAALIRFGWLDDEQVRRAIDWQVASITGEGPISWFRSGTTGPGFRCRLNGELPCAWGRSKRSVGSPRSRWIDARSRSAGRSKPESNSCYRSIQHPQPIRPRRGRAPTGSSSASHPDTSLTSCRSWRYWLTWVWPATRDWPALSIWSAPSRTAGADGPTNTPTPTRRGFRSRRPDRRASGSPCAPAACSRLSPRRRARADRRFQRPEAIASS